LKTIGITGGIGSGKTTCCRIFETLGIPVYYADVRAKKLMTSDKLLKSQIKDLLGKESYYRNGRLNRGFIASQIFNNRSLLKQMNALVHPTVKEVKARMRNQLAEEKKIAVADYVIVNDGNEMLIPQIMEIHEEILGL